MSTSFYEISLQASAQLDIWLYIWSSLQSFINMN